MALVNLKSYAFKNSSPNIGTTVAQHGSNPTIVARFNMEVNAGDLVKLTGQFNINNDSLTTQSLNVLIYKNNIGNIIYNAFVEVDPVDDGGLINVERTDNVQLSEVATYFLAVTTSAIIGVTLQNPISFTGLRMEPI